MFKGYRAPVSNDEKVLEMASGEGCTRMWRYLMPPVKVNFMGQLDWP